MATTTTNVEQVKVNVMTKQQYDLATKSATELYMVTDVNDVPSQTGQSGKFLTTNGSATSWADVFNSTTVTIAANAWSSYTASVTISGLTSNSIVIVSPAGSSMTDYANAGVYASAQSANTLTFTCSETPTSSLSINVVYN